MNTNRHRWARLMKHKLSITVYLCRPRKTNFRLSFPFAANARKFAVTVFHLQKTNGSRRFLLVPLSVYKNGFLKGQISEILIRFLNLYDMDRPICEYKMLLVEHFLRPPQF
jgi:hypothetical protein